MGLNVTVSGARQRARLSAWLDEKISEKRALRIVFRPEFMKVIFQRFAMQVYDRYPRVLLQLARSIDTCKDAVY